MSAEETPAETIERLLKANNRLAQMVKASSDRLAESARELLAQGWDAGAKAAWERSTPTVNGMHYEWRHEGDPLNPYRQPINLPGATE